MQGIHGVTSTNVMRELGFHHPLVATKLFKLRGASQSLKSESRSWPCRNEFEHMIPYIVLQSVYAQPFVVISL